MPLWRPSIAAQDPRRFEICMKAARAFVERGFDATSVNDIAAALGVTKPGLYHYITSKEALFFDIVSLGMDWLDEDVIKPVEGIKDPEERLRQIILRHATLTACNEGWITILLDEMHALPSGQRKKIERRKRRYMELVRDTLRELEAAGRLRDVDPTVATLAVLGMIIWLPRWVRPGGRLTPEHVAAQVSQLALDGLLRPTDKRNNRVAPMKPRPGGLSRAAQKSR
jgi:TetR/AcrR family transcriptional regulator, cholesterol catabolism regulator